MISLKNTTDQILDWVLPPRCIISGEPVDRQGLVSAAIWQKISFITAPFCACCGVPFGYAEAVDQEGRFCGGCLSNKPFYNEARAAMVYDDTSRPLVLGFKHGDKTHMAKTFAQWIVQAAQLKERVDPADMCVPVPLHYHRLVKRRYNQAGILADQIARQSGIQYIPDLLRRIRSTPPQGHKKWKERQDNVKGAFALSPHYKEQVAERTIWLVDDVLTTGATVNACAKVLCKAGAKEVNVLALARVVRPDML